MPGSLTFATPLAGLLAALAVVPLAACWLAARRVQRVRSILRLAAPARPVDRGRLVALAAVPLLLAVAAMQPSLRRHPTQSLRVDAAVMAVLDTSSSMQAAPGARAPTRLGDAKRIALAVGSRLGGIPLGVASFTDRVLPNLFPTGDRAAYDSTVRSLSIASPPPRETARIATSFGGLAALARSNYFTPAERHRALLLITDGESRPFDAASVARALKASPRIAVVVVRVGGGSDRLYANGRPAGRYRPDPGGAARAVSQLVSSAGGRAFTTDAAGAAGALRAYLGPGRSKNLPSLAGSRNLAGLIVLLSVIPVLSILVGSFRSLRAERRFS
jgi:hypothetical protein